MVARVVFIDGEAGTTGLGIASGESAWRNPIPQIAPEKRKDPAKAKRLMAEVDLVVLCLPDDAAKQTAAAADSCPAAARGSSMPRPRTGSPRAGPMASPSWPGAGRCHPRRPPRCQPRLLSDRRHRAPPPPRRPGSIPADYPVTVNAVSGYSGGGKSMIEAYESGKAPAFELYSLGLEHKHVPELQKYAGLSRRPIFVPSVGNFRQGMLVSVPLHLDTLPGKPSAPARSRPCLPSTTRAPAG